MIVIALSDGSGVVQERWSTASDDTVIATFGMRIGVDDVVGFRLEGGGVIWQV